ncbi:hypothetical protein C8J57DRAFT_1719803 [Mycena rebaudengoi]|nr:hypothetical protein C8J57DRAFT_1719803 [Mycena rebaudengoi]
MPHYQPMPADNPNTIVLLGLTPKSACGGDPDCNISFLPPHIEQVRAWTLYSLPFGDNLCPSPALLYVVHLWGVHVFQTQPFVSSENMFHANSVARRLSHLATTISVSHKTPSSGRTYSRCLGRDLSAKTPEHRVAFYDSDREGGVCYEATAARRKGRSRRRARHVQYTARASVGPSPPA